MKRAKAMTRSERTAMDRLFAIVVAQRELNKARGKYAMARRWSDRYTPDEVEQATKEYQAARDHLRDVRALNLA